MIKLKSINECAKCKTRKSINTSRFEISIIHLHLKRVVHRFSCNRIEFKMKTLHRDTSKIVVYPWHGFLLLFFFWKNQHSRARFHNYIFIRYHLFIYLFFLLSSDFAQKRIFAIVQASSRKTKTIRPFICFEFIAGRQIQLFAKTNTFFFIIIIIFTLEKQKVNQTGEMNTVLLVRRGGRKRNHYHTYVLYPALFRYRWTRGQTSGAVNKYL